MPDHVQCDVCGRWLDDNQNDSGFTKKGNVMNLCTLHHAAAKRVARRGRVNWRVMSLATFALNRKRPRRDQLEQWADWDPLDRLVELYEQLYADAQSRRAKD